MELTMPTPISELFPLSIAQGESFCNRTDETERLVDCLKTRRPTLLISPRRYGKTSLALRAIKLTKIPYAHIDLFSAIDELDIESAILKGVGQLISQMETTLQKAFTLAGKVFDGSKVKIGSNKLGIELEVGNEKTKPAQRILQVFERLEELAKQRNNKLIIFFDEFQCLGQVSADRSMEAVLRQVAQLTQSISFVFSGSSRHLLSQLFDDRKRPFYKLCERITVERISEKHYSEHLQTLAHDRWGKKLSKEVLESIYECTARHPYYMNALCYKYFSCNSPSEKNIFELWENYVAGERSSIGAELELLNQNQRKLLTLIARHKCVFEPSGKDFLQKSNMSKTTLIQSLKVLENRDYICRNAHNEAHVLDPLIQSVLQ